MDWRCSMIFDAFILSEFCFIISHLCLLRRRSFCLGGFAAFLLCLLRTSTAQSLLSDQLLLEGHSSSAESEADKCMQWASLHKMILDCQESESVQIFMFAQCSSMLMIFFANWYCSSHRASLFASLPCEFSSWAPVLELAPLKIRWFKQGSRMFKSACFFHLRRCESQHVPSVQHWDQGGEESLWQISPYPNPVASHGQYRVAMRRSGWPEEILRGGGLEPSKGAAMDICLPWCIHICRWFHTVSTVHIVH